MQSKISMELLVKGNFRARKEGRFMQIGLICLVWFNLSLFLCQMSYCSLLEREKNLSRFFLTKSLRSIIKNTVILNIYNILPWILPELEVFLTTL